MFRTDGFQDLLVSMPERVRIEHPSRFGRREHVGISRVLLVLIHQQVHCLLRDRQDADGIVGLGLTHHQFSLGAGHLLCDGDSLVLHIQIRPEEGQQLSPPQSRGQFQIEWRQQTPLVRFHQIGPNFLFRQNLHLPLLHLWQFAASRGVHQDQPLRYRLLQAVVQQGVDAVEHPDAQALVFQLDVLVPLHPPILLKIVVELLDLDRGKLVQLDISQFGDDVVIDVVQIIVFGVLPKPGLGVDLVPHQHPTLYRMGATAVHVQPLTVCDDLFQLLFDLRLGLSQNILNFLLPGRRVIGGRVEPLPPAILPFADTAFAVGTFLPHLSSLFSCQLTGPLFVLVFKVVRRLVCQQLLLDTLGQTVTGDEAVETRFLPQSVFQIRHLQEQFPLRLIQQTGELPMGPFDFPVQILRPPGCRLEPAAEGFHIITHHESPPVSDTQYHALTSIATPTGQSYQFVSKFKAAPGFPGAAVFYWVSCFPIFRLIHSRSSSLGITMRLPILSAGKPSDRANS